MKKILFSLSVILLLCFSVSAQEYDYCAGASGAAAACSTSTDYIGSKATTGTSTTATADYVRCTRFQATEMACSSATLNTGYLYHTGTSSDNAKIAVFGRASADVGASPTTDDVLIGTWGTIESYAVNGGYGSVPIGSGTIVKDRWYWACFITDATVWERVADATVGTNCYKNIAGSYTNPPEALADDYTTSTTTYRMYFTIGP